MGVGPVPSRVTREYIACELGLEGDDALRCERVIARVDIEYLRLASDVGKRPGREADSVSVDDHAGMRRLFKNIAARKRSQTKP